MPSAFFFLCLRSRVAAHEKLIAHGGAAKAGIERYVERIRGLGSRTRVRNIFRLAAAGRPLAIRNEPRGTYPVGWAGWPRRVDRRIGRAGASGIRARADRLIRTDDVAAAGLCRAGTIRVAARARASVPAHGVLAPGDDRADTIRVLTRARAAIRARDASAPVLCGTVAVWVLTGALRTVVADDFGAARLLWPESARK